MGLETLWPHALGLLVWGAAGSLFGRRARRFDRFLGVWWLLELASYFVLSPWPFRSDVVTVEGQARPLPAAGRFADEAAMRAWLEAPQRTTFHARVMADAS